MKQCSFVQKYTWHRNTCNPSVLSITYVCTTTLAIYADRAQNLVLSVIKLGKAYNSLPEFPRRFAGGAGEENATTQNANAVAPYAV